MVRKVRTDLKHCYGGLGQFFYYINTKPKKPFLLGEREHVAMHRSGQGHMQGLQKERAFTAAYMTKNETNLSTYNCTLF